MFCACDRSQVLKKMFNITNYKAAPYSTLSFWATKTARSRFVIDTRGWSEENYVVANTECTEIETGIAIRALSYSTLQSQTQQVLQPHYPLFNSKNMIAVMLHLK